MDRRLTLAGAFGLSLIVALVAAWRLAEHFWYGEDLDLFIPPVAGFVLAITMVFAVADARARERRMLGLVALGLAAAALAFVVTPFLAEHVAAQSKNPEVVLRPRSAKIKTVLLIPMLLAVATQWWFVRRRWLQARDLDPRTAWPWITTIAACVVMLSPIGLAILDAAVTQSVTDWFRGLWLIVALAFGGIVLLAGLIEWGIRARMRRKSLAPQGP
ncbi:MAG: hypothetical protein WCE79_00480 [Xanthobacteraceae bacterium]